MLSKINPLPVLFLVAAVLLSTVVSADASKNQAEQEINYLLQYVGTSGATFIRNGDEHSAQDAADHMAMKYRRASRYAKTAEDFIDNLASKSSFSGKPYTVVTADGENLKSRDWLYSALEDYRQNQTARTTD